jgi:D-tyrosyl-tRNA(Tyr) deacylase
VEGEIVGSIEWGLTIFLGVEQGDTAEKAARLAQKIVGLRVFDNTEGKFDLSLKDVGGSALVIPNFTLCGDARKGTRPNFSAAAPPSEAKLLYEQFVTLLGIMEYSWRPVALVLRCASAWKTKARSR